MSAEVTSVQPRVAIVIPNWNGWQDTIECLESIWKLNYSDCWAVVVDNGSSDDSVMRIREYCGGNLPADPESGEELHLNRRHIRVVDIARPEALTPTRKDLGDLGPSTDPRLVLIRNESNLGFAEGSNVGMVFALNTLDAQYIMLLNNDTVVDSEMLTELVAAAEKSGDIGILGPKTYYYSFQGRKDVILYAGGKIVPWRDIVYKHIGTGERDVGQYDRDYETDWCTGGGMMVRAELARKRLLNAEYPFGNEDAEYSMKARADGWRVVYAHKAKMWHKVGVSRAKTGATLRRGIYWYFRFIWSNFSLPWYIYHVFLFMTVILPKWFFMYIAFSGDAHALRGFISEIKRLVS